MKIAVITVSDRAAAGIYVDASGPAVEETLWEYLPDADIERSVVPDDMGEVKKALERHVDAEWILTTGGTGPGPRDLTPEATRLFCDRPLPGIADYLRSESLKETPNAVFSRQYSGMRGKVFVVNLPGSVKGARFCARLLAPLMEHGSKMAAGEGH